MSHTTNPPAASPRGRARDLLGAAATASARSSFAWILAVLLALIVVFAVISPTGSFLSVLNAKNVSIDASTLLVLGTAATFVIISGGLDLSIGSVMTFAAVAATLVMKDVSDGGAEHAWLAIGCGVVVAVLAGAAWGALNGFFVARIGLPPFVVTLGSLGAALGAARLLSDGTTVTGVPSQLQRDIGLGEVLGIPLPFVLAFAVVLVFGTLLAKTRFGEHTYFVGSNEMAAARGGVRVRRQQFLLYVISGSLAGFAGILDVARFEVATVATGHTTELISAIAAVVIGGASLFGGVGTIAGTVIGVFIPTVLNNGFLIMGVQRFWQDIAVGAILVGAVWFDQWRRRRDQQVT